jgi:hypothetical protein
LRKRAPLLDRQLAPGDGRLLDELQFEHAVFTARLARRFVEFDGQPSSRMLCGVARSVRSGRKNCRNSVSTAPAAGDSSPFASEAFAGKRMGVRDDVNWPIMDLPWTMDR